jgi:hypothetical protein
MTIIFITQDSSTYDYDIEDDGEGNLVRNTEEIPTSTDADQLTVRMSQSFSKKNIAAKEEIALPLKAKWS